MTLLNTDTRWGLLSQTLHWLMFLLILGAWFAVETREEFPKGSAERTEWMLLHKSLGVSIFFLVWLRIGARFSQVTPKEAGAGVMALLAKLVGLGLYGVMIAMPLTGMLISGFEGKPVMWFGVFELPALVGENAELAETFEELHEAGFGFLLFLLFLHVAGALKHHFVAKNDVLRRMLPWGSSR